jgi:hypothetical protein
VHCLGLKAQLYQTLRVIKGLSNRSANFNARLHQCLIALKIGKPKLRLPRLTKPKQFARTPQGKITACKLKTIVRLVKRPKPYLCRLRKRFLIKKNAAALARTPSNVPR